MRRLLLAVCWVCAAATPAAAQRAAADGSAVRRGPPWRSAVTAGAVAAPGVAEAAVLAPTPGATVTVPLARRPWVRPLASLLVPGSGQLLARQPRGIVYLATEVWLLARAVALRRSSADESAFFRSLAYTVARRRYGYGRVDGAWPYYEEMSKYIESGVFNGGSATVFVPEDDTTTFNGHIWQLARRTYFEDPDSTPEPTSPQYAAALRFYQGRAVTDGFRWSWRDARLEQDVYRASIRASDEAYRAATNYLGAVLLNHLVSAVDAFIATRLGRSGVLPAVRPAAAGPGAVLEWRAHF